MPRHLLAIPAVLALSTACTPQSATLTDGGYTAFLSVSTSPTISKDSLKLAKDGVDPSGFDTRLEVDCRDGVDVPLLPGADASKCPAVADVEHERWLQYDGYEILSSQMDPWRGEAIMTAEGDLQITFHQRLPNGQDFRFAMVVDPQFQPTQCTLDSTGASVRQPVDGDWLAEWSKDAADMGGGTLFYLNSGAYQFNPSNTEVTWVLPEKWRAGTAIAKFAEEDFYLRAPRYGMPSAYSAYDLDSAAAPDASDLFYTPGLADDPGYSAAYDDMVTRVQDVADKTATEFSTVANITMQPLVHDNRWRVPDDISAGIDGWVELDYNWVRFDQAPGDLAVGNPATGDFYLTLVAVGSQSELTVHGSFDIPKIKADKWTVPDLTAQKQEEYGTALCGDTAPAQ